MADAKNALLAIKVAVESDPDAEELRKSKTLKESKRLRKSKRPKLKSSAQDVQTRLRTQKAMRSASSSARCSVRLEDMLIIRSVC